MKTMKIVIFMVMFAVFTSCSTTSIFPVSEVTPAAEVKAKLKKEMKNVYSLTLVAENLSSPDRLTPKRNFYVIWVVSETGGVRNVGHFSNKNAQVSEYRASFPYKPAEVFITAEDEEAGCKPNGLEISRLKFD
jgi:PBP1b-binding outer membrane lipoprotein LpoB